MAVTMLRDKLFCNAWLGVLCLLSVSATVTSDGVDWSSVDTVLTNAVADHATPGLVAAVASDFDEPLYLRAFGHLTYDETSPPVTADTRYDVASLTKVLASTTCVMHLVQTHRLALDAPVTDILGPEFAAGGKTTVTLRHLLTHSAGLIPDPIPSYFSLEFGCPETVRADADGGDPTLVFNCLDKVWASLMGEVLVAEPGDKTRYSDLSFITISFMIGAVVRDAGLVDTASLLPSCINAGVLHTELCYYEAYLRTFIMPSLGVTAEMFSFLPRPEDYPMTPPAWDDPKYHHGLIQGFVSDENSYAMGGISGHAGVFATAGAAAKIAQRILFATEDDALINAATVREFTHAQRPHWSSRALGWDTNDHFTNSYLGCGDMSDATWYHTGYTGTQVCADPTTRTVAVLMTNRCFPIKTYFTKIKTLRRSFSNAVNTLAMDAIARNGAWSSADIDHDTKTVTDNDKKKTNHETPVPRLGNESQDKCGNRCLLAIVGILFVMVAGAIFGPQLAEGGASTASATDTGNGTSMQRLP